MSAFNMKLYEYDLFNVRSYSNTNVVLLMFRANLFFSNSLLSFIKQQKSTSRKKQRFSRQEINRENRLCVVVT